MFVFITAARAWTCAPELVTIPGDGVEAPPNTRIYVDHGGYGPAGLWDNETCERVIVQRTTLPFAAQGGPAEIWAPLQSLKAGHTYYVSNGFAQSGFVVASGSDDEAPPDPRFESRARHQDVGIFEWAPGEILQFEDPGELGLLEVGGLGPDGETLGPWLLPDSRLAILGTALCNFESTVPTLDYRGGEDFALEVRRVDLAGNRSCPVVFELTTLESRGDSDVRAVYLPNGGQSAAAGSLAPFACGDTQGESRDVVGTGDAVRPDVSCGVTPHVRIPDPAPATSARSSGCSSAPGWSRLSVLAQLIGRR